MLKVVFAIVGTPACKCSDSSATADGRAHSQGGVQG